MELTKNGNKIERSFIGNYDLFLTEVKGLSRLYDNGFTAAYQDDQKLVTFCEGDLAIITGENLEKEIQDHLNYFKENC